MKSLILWAAVCSAAWCGAVTRYVSPGGLHQAPFTNWAGAATDVASALAVSADGDEILVTNGVYALTDTLACTNARVTLRSVNGAGATALEGNGTFMLVYLDQFSVLDGFTLRGGHNETEPGGALELATGIMRNCVLTSCSAIYGGAAMVGSDAIMEDCSIYGNSASHAGGGAIVAEGGIMRRCVLYDNHVTGTGVKEDLYIGGGALLAFFGGYVAECVMSNNTSTLNGGGIVFWGTSIVERCLISDNTAVGDGGGVYFDDAGVLRSSLVRGNSAANGGGAASLTNGALQNCTIVGNTALTNAGGVLVLASGRSENSIVYYNSAPSGSNYFAYGSATYRFTCAEPLMSGLGCISNEPQFINYSAGNLRLPASSPCVDTGTNLPGLRLLMDFDHNCRVSNCVDMGAFERSFPAPALAITTSLEYVTYDGAQLALAGTNTPGLDAGMRVRNMQSGAQLSFSRSGTAWNAPPIPLLVGDNTLVVTATNTEGFACVDSITIARGGPGTGAPFVDITNNHCSVIYDINALFVAGTNNDNIVGTLTISNRANNYVTFFSPLSNWFSVHVPLAPNTNEIFVYGANLAGDTTNDMLMVVRQLATGQPFIDITNAAAWVSHDITNYVLAGTNNTQVAAGMWVSNATAGGVAQSFPAAAAWTSPAVALLEGTNLLVVFGTNLIDNVTNDSVVIVRGGWGTGAPFIDCTTAVAQVEHETAAYAFAGTNNGNVVGGMWISNQVNNAVQHFSAAAGWQSPPLDLVEGLNDIWVYGTNQLGALAGELVLMTRKGAATGPPFLDVTSTNFASTFDLISATVQGTNNQYVVGAMWVSNAANHTVQYFSAALQWTTPPLPLDVGTNVLWVFGQNAALSQVWDSVTVTRGLPGTGAPFVDITNGDAIVTFDVTTFAAAGTNNPNILPGGAMWVSNALNGTAAAFTAGAAWAAPPLPLEVGTNLFVVSGTNSFGEPASATALVWRQGPGSGVPFVDILPPIPAVGAEQNVLILPGSNNLNVVGMMWVSNSANDVVESFPAETNWFTPPVLLAAGTNVITVYGTNFVRQTAYDTTLIIRADPGFGTPWLAITSTALNVTYDAATYALAGTNNINVIGGMWVSNAANNAVASFAATSGWIAAAIPLVTGANPLTVYGSNVMNDVAADTRIVSRGPAGSGVPYVAITSAVTTVGPFDETYVLAGSNNANVVGGMWVSNDSMMTVHSFDAQPYWASPPIALDRHINILSVCGTNAAGAIATDYLVVDRAVPVGVTNYVAGNGGHVWPYLSWATAATNLEEAVNEAPGGNLVLIGPGTNWLFNPLVLDRDLCVQSAEGMTASIIMVQLSQTASAFTLHTGVLDGVTIAAAPGTAVPRDGGAVYLANGGAVINCTLSGFAVSNNGAGVYCAGGLVSNCVLTGNTAAWQGGGVFLSGGGVLRDSYLSHNTAVQGGGALLTLNASAAYTIFHSNTAVTSVATLAELPAVAPKASPGYGGAVCLINGGLVDRCELHGNTAYNGSAAALFSGGTLQYSSINNNHAAYYAAVYCQYGGRVDACTIIENTALNTAGVMLDNGGQARNCVIGLNWAEDTGGATLIGNTLMENCTVCANTADDTVGGVALNGNATLRNTILFHNTSGAASNYIVQGGAPVFTACCADPLPAGAGNISGDPALAYPPAGYFRLSALSPCRDAGTNDLAWMTGAVDISGRPRIIGPSVDIGAYEFTNEPIIWTSARRLDFGDVVIDEAAAQSLSFGNAGSEQLTGQITGVAAPFALNSSASYALPPQGASTAMFSFVPSVTGQFVAYAALSGGDATDVILTGNGVPEPAVFLAALVFVWLSRPHPRTGIR